MYKEKYNNGKTDNNMLEKVRLLLLKLFKKRYFCFFKKKRKKDLTREGVMW